MITLLIERKASLDLRDSTECTALISACSRGYSRIACRLLEAGADPSICSTSGHPPFHFADVSGDLQTMATICKVAKPGTRYDAPVTLVKACEADDVKTIASWLDLGQPVNAEWRVALSVKNDDQADDHRRASRTLETTVTLLHLAVHTTCPCTGNKGVLALLI